MGDGLPTVGGLKRLSQLMAGQPTTNVAITGGAIDGTTVGSTTPAAGAFTTISATTLNAAGLKLPWSTTAAAGSASSDAAAITVSSGGVVLVTGGNAAAGVILPVCTTASGSSLYAIYNNATGTNTLKIYPAGAEKINGAASITITSSVLAVIVAAAIGSWAATYRATT